MPLHRKGDHTIDCPPIFRCRVHKQALVFSIEFCEEIMDYAEDRVPGNLNDMTRKPLGNRPAYSLPSNLSNPKVVLFNPDDAQGVDAIPFLIARVNNRFVGIPARYLDACRFDGCDDCLKAGFVEPPPLQEPLGAVSRGRTPSRPMTTSKRSGPPGPPGPPKKKTQRMPRSPSKLQGPNPTGSATKKAPPPHANHPSRPRRPGSDSKRLPDLKRPAKTESGPVPAKARRDGPPLTSSGRMSPPPKNRVTGDKSTGRMKRPSKEEMQSARAEGLKRKGPPPGPPSGPPSSPPPGPPRKGPPPPTLNKEQAKKANEETAEFAPPPRDEMEKARQEGIARKAANMKELAKKQGTPAKVGPPPSKVDDTDDYDDFMMFADSADEAGSG